MKYWKLCFFACAAVSILLFIAGIGTLVYIKSNVETVSTNKDTGKAESGGNTVNDIIKPFKSSSKPFNVLILGGDRVAGNSDTMILVNYDPVTYKVNLMSIPRDTKVIIDNEYRSINFAYPHAGMDLAVKTVSELLDVNIKYYLYLDTSAFRKIVDLLGGVYIDVPIDMDYDDSTQNLHIHLKKGYQLLDGEHAEQYVRFRKGKYTSGIREYYDGSDLDRIKAQQAFIKELIRQKLNIQYIPKINSLLQVLYDSVKTNFSLTDLLNLSLNIGKLDTNSFNFISMPGKTIDGSPYYFCNVEKAREITTQNFQGDESYLSIDGRVKDLYANNPAITDGKDDGTIVDTRDTTRNNPSNNDSSLDGKQSPAP